MKIVNLTQHNSTTEQKKEGVFDVKDKDTLRELLTFNELPSAEEVEGRADALVSFAKNETKGLEGDKDKIGVMVGGAPYLMPALTDKLQKAGFTVLFAFSVRESVEKKLPNGDIQKVNIFRHKGFVQL